MSTISPEELQKGLKLVVKDSVASQAVTTLSAGTFLVAFALELGASNLVIGILAGLTPLIQLVQLPSIYLVERFKNRRKIVVISSLIGRIFLLLIAAIPFLFDLSLGLFFLVVFVAINSVFSAITSCSWNSWMRDLLPQDSLGALFSKKMIWATIFGIFFSLLGGYFIDQSDWLFPGNPTWVYSVLFFMAFISGILSSYYMSRIPEPPMVPSGLNLIKLISVPFKDANFKNLIKFLGTWNFAVNLAAPFFTVYMLQRLEIPMSMVVILVTVSQVANIMLLKTWGRISDQYSNKTIMAICGPLFIFTILLWTFTTFPDKHFLTIPMLFGIHFLMGASTAGISIASGNIGLKLAPHGGGLAYLAVISIVNSVAAGLAPILGGVFADYFLERKLSLVINWSGPEQNFTIPTIDIQQWDFFFLISFGIGLYSIQRLFFVIEKGEISEKIVLAQIYSELKGHMKNLSSVGGMRSVIGFPFGVIRNIPILKKFLKSDHL
ncbi:MAG: MFS family permease [Bacteroidia bacterium]|jgi:MFS family permease